MNEKKKLKDLRDRIKTMKEEDKQKVSLSNYACANPMITEKGDVGEDQAEEEDEGS